LDHEYPYSYRITTSDGGESFAQHGGRGIKTLIETYIMISENHHTNGSVLCIDDVGSGLHPDILEALSTILYEQAVRYDVTLFMSTNSKEFVDCLLYDDKRASECVLYVLGNGIRRFSGEDAAKAISVSDVDFRRI
jgi:AAA15 family ATPase/GTPase